MEADVPSSAHREIWEILQEAAGLVESSLALESDPCLTLAASLTSCVNPPGTLLTLMKPQSPRLENTVLLGVRGSRH